MEHPRSVKDFLILECCNSDRSLIKSGVYPQKTSKILIAFYEKFNVEHLSKHYLDRLKI